MDPLQPTYTEPQKDIEEGPWGKTTVAKSYEPIAKGPWEKIETEKSKDPASLLTDKFLSKVSKLAKAKETKICPYCAEEIKLEAKKCKHCSEWLK